MNNDENIHLGEFFGKYFRCWKIYVPVGIVCLALAIIYVIVTPKQYEITARMQLMNEESDMKSELKMLGSAGGLIGGLGGSSLNTENEIAIISSREVLGSAIKESGLQTMTSTWRGLRCVNLDIEESPLKVMILPEILDTLSKPVTLKFSVKGNKLENLVASSSLFEKTKLGERTLPCVISLPIGNIAIERNAAGDGDYKLKLQPLQYLYEKHFDKLEIEAIEKISDVIQISENSADVKTVSRMINAIISNYNSYSRKIKVEKTNINADFVRNRLDTITRELALLEYKIENYKQTNKIPEPTIYATTTYYGNETADQKLYELQVNARMIDYVLDYISQPSNEYAPIPAVEEIGGLGNAYNQQLLNRQRLLITAEKDNPMLILAEKQLAEERKALVKTLNSAKEQLQITVEALNKKYNTLENKLDKLPKQEREYIEMMRQQKIYETMYVFLMQKLQEKEISNSPDEVAAVVVDKAYRSFRHVAPKGSIVLIIAFMMACIISFIIISIRLYFANDNGKPDSESNNGK